MATTENAVATPTTEETPKENTTDTTVANDTTKPVAQNGTADPVQNGDATKTEAASTEVKDGAATGATPTPAASSDTTTTEAKPTTTTTETAPAEEKKEEPAPPAEPEPHVVEAEELFKKLSGAPEDQKSLLRVYLTQAVFDKLKAKKTTLGGTLADCIRSGVENLDSTIGAYACDAEGYKVFAELFDPIIRKYFNLAEKKTLHQPKYDFGDPEKVAFEALDPDGKFIVSTRLRIGRSQVGSGFPPVLNIETRAQLETKAVEAFGGFGETIKGKYHKYAEIDADTQKALKEDNLFFDDNDRFHKSSGCFADWPENRGIFLNDDRSLTVWVNEEDHLRLFSTQKGGDFQAAYKMLVSAVKSLEGKLSFSRDDKLGFMTFCPSNLGTTLHATVQVKVPQLAEVAPEKFKAACEKFFLDAEAVEGSAPGSGEYQLSNKRRIGITELQVITEVFNGLKEIIRLEKEAAWRPANLDEMFDHLTKAKTCKSLLKKYLTKEIFDKLKEKKTPLESTLGDAIISGTIVLDSVVGVYAPDTSSYTEFAPLFDPIIKEFHKCTIAQPATEFGDLENLDFSTVDDAEGTIVLDTRVEVSRSLTDFAFSPVLKTEDRAQVEQKSTEVLNGLDAEMKGKYESLAAMSKELQEELSKQRLLFSNDDRLLKFAACYKDWPANRGVFVNEDRTFAVWVNNEDHLQIITRQKGSDLAAVYKKLVTAVKLIDEKMSFVRDERLGYLTTSPTNIGTGLRASVLVKIPNLVLRKNFKTLIDGLKLQAKAIEGDGSPESADMYEISNKRTLGVTEIDAVKELMAGAKEVVRLEKEGVPKKSSCTVL